MNLEGTIQSYNNVGTSMDESELQMLSWLKELQDLRKILTETPSKELMEELDANNDTDLLIDTTESFDAYAAQDPAEHMVQFWLRQLRKARKRIEKDIA